MSIIQKLSEGIVNRDLKKEGQALLTKWEATGLLEGIDTQQGKHNMARLLENQAKELLRESNAMSNGQVEGFATVAFPIVRRVFAGLIANDLVSVQPMSLPSGLIFFLDFVYSPRIGDNNVTDAGSAQNGRMGNRASKSIYGTNQVGSEVINGVDLVNNTNKSGFSGPGRDGMVGYGYANATASSDQVSAGAANMKVQTFLLDGAVSETRKKLIKYDPDLLAQTDSSRGVIVLDIAKSAITSSLGPADFDNLAAFELQGLIADGTNANNLLATLAANSSGITSGSATSTGLIADHSIAQVRRLSSVVKDAADSYTLTAGSGDSVRFVISAGSSVVTAASAAAHGSDDLEAAAIIFPVRDQFGVNSGATLGVIDDFNFPFEGNGDMPEIDIKVDSIAITAQTKKLKAKWTPELGQDLNAYHNLDAEVELTSILSEQIALEIDRELLADLVNGATAATYYWSRAPGLFVNRQTGAELGASSAAPDFTGTVSEWYETLIETINDVSAQIHLKTLRGGANYVVCSPEVANILEFTSGYRANVTADADKGTIGAVKVGSLSRKFDIIVDPYFPRNAILVGRKGGSFLESGYVYAPYVPLQTTPTIFGVEDFVPRKGVMTRYGKKMVRPDMYGLVIVRGLTGEEGSS
jgi:hypothetical protein